MPYNYNLNVVFLATMIQYKSPNKEVEVNKPSVLTIVNSMERGRETRVSILLEHGINIEKGEWFNLQKFLDGLSGIARNIGPMNLFLIGKAVIDNSEFPPIKDLEEGLRSLNIAYHMNHRLDGKPLFDPATGKIRDVIGNYELTEFDAQSKKAVIVCDGPYPSKFDEGIITQMVRRFKPISSFEKIELDPTKETRREGAAPAPF